MSVKKKTGYLNKNKKDEVNKKAIIWICSILGVVIVLMTVLLIVNG